MTKSIDFYFDIISPYSYLAHKKIRGLREKEINFNYKPILVGGLHNLLGIKAPAFIKPKLNHMINDCTLFAKKDNFKFIWNSNFPINSLSLMRGYLFIENDKKELYLDIMFDGYWKDNLDLSKEEILIKLLKKCNIDENIFLEGIKDSKIKDELKSVTKEARDKDIFGAPTFLINNKIFWGQDRLEFALEEYSK
ncbi:2-hydroxychromene-2-carboxylate isomerase [Candidatus Pelagibacter sp.]|nr:2-hydroxychromene-2-carboxylate isomerase [Candidatus Pelagibacter sp.]